MEEVSEEEYKKQKKSRQKKVKLCREDFGDPSEIESFRGPWSSFIDVTETRKDPMKAKEELSLRRIVNKHCLVLGKEKSRTSGIFSMDVYLDMGRSLVKRFVSPRVNTMLFHEHRDMVTSVQLFSKFQLALSSSFDGKVCLHSLRNDKGLLTTYMGHSRAVSSAVLDGDERRFNTISFDGFFKGWSVETGRCDLRIDASAPLTCQTPQTPNKTSFVGGVDGKIRILDLRSRTISKEIRACEGGFEEVKNIEFGPKSVLSICAVDSDNILASSARDGSLHFWDLRNDEIIRSYENSYSFISFNEKKKCFVVVSDGKVDFLGITSLEKIGKEVKVSGCSTGVVTSEDGDTLCYGNREGMIGIVDCKSMEATSIGLASERVTSVDWTRGGSSSFMSGDVLGNVKIWE